jgi:protein O-mannosyl-transferase
MTAISGKDKQHQNTRKYFSQEKVQALILILLAGIIYAYSLTGEFLWDDEALLFNNAIVKNPDGIYQVWNQSESPDYYPVTLSMFWIEWRLFGMNPFGYRLINLIFHCCSGLLLWRILRNLKINGAYLASLLFLLHPVNVSSVAWIVERKNTACLFFYLLSAFLLTQFHKTNLRLLYRLSLFFFCVALLSKTAVVMFPITLLGMEWIKGRKISRACITEILPYFLASLILGLITIYFQYNNAIQSDVVRPEGFLSRLAASGWAFWFYLYKAVIPLNLNFVYRRWTVDPDAFANYLPLLAFLLLLSVFVKFRRKFEKQYLAGIGYFTLNLLPIVGFFNIYFMKYSLVADHWQYVSLPGITALAAYEIHRVTGLLGERNGKRTFMIIGFALVFVFSGLTWFRSSRFISMKTLWEDVLEKNPGCWMAELNLGLAYTMHEQWDNAIPFLEGSIAHQPGLSKTQTDEIIGEASKYLGDAWTGKHDIPKAIGYFEKSIELTSKVPGAYNNLAWILSTSEDPRYLNPGQAVVLAEKVIEMKRMDLDPSYFDTLAAAYASSERFPEAVAAAQKGIDLATQSGNSELAQLIRTHKTLFEQNQRIIQSF